MISNNIGNKILGIFLDLKYQYWGGETVLRPVALFRLSGFGISEESERGRTPEFQGQKRNKAEKGISVVRDNRVSGA
jgi:hypothetical protein